MVKVIGGNFVIETVTNISVHQTRYMAGIPKYCKKVELVDCGIALGFKRMQLCNAVCLIQTSSENYM